MSAEMPTFQSAQYEGKKMKNRHYYFGIFDKRNGKTFEDKISEINEEENKNSVRYISVSSTAALLIRMGIKCYELARREK